MHISVTDIKKRYGKKEVLKNISFSASGGECIGIIGKNGSGKSTLISILAGIIRADAGSFFVEDRDALKEDTVRHDLVAYVPQGTPIIEELSARDNLRMWYRPEDLKKQLESGFLKVLGIDEFLDVTAGKMSLGMKKRLSIGCAINNNPKVLLLDEPTAALDLVCKEAVYAYLRAFMESGGVLILATHDIYEISMCSGCYLLKEGILEPYSYNNDMTDLLNSI